MTTTQLQFQVIEGWEKAPTEPNLKHEDVAAVAVDSQDRVYLHTRHGDRVMVYDEDGKFLGAWGDGVFGNAHGITIGPDDSVYCTDNRDHVIRKFTLDGKPLMTFGTPGAKSDTGYDTSGKPKIHHNETVARSAGPFNSVCNTAIAPNGDLFVADGYGNARVHHFKPDGTLVRSWGTPGTAAGEFHLPHGIALDNDGNVIVADRENDRLQFFNAEGKYLYEWNDVQRPTAVTVGPDGLIYVSELWRPSEPGQGSFVHGYVDYDQPGRVSVFDSSGAVVARWGASSTDRAAPGNFVAPHGICLDHKGNLYVSEVTGTYGVRLKRTGPETADHQIQKFTRR
ncbi:MAG TPA: peptidyl-alpha-hydroxyglycine alpha-amidating lyase family protein [Dehalococcoidia bacterium]|nr:peptidyl-alpha-hydroxyglycine alpha-amidating lyase family protein [Dehalococcoidia bacterium]